MRVTLLLPVYAQVCAYYQNSGFWNPAANWFLELQKSRVPSQRSTEIPHTAAGALQLIQGHQKTHPEPALEGEFRPEYKNSCLGLGQTFTAPVIGVYGDGRLLLFCSFITRRKLTLGQI